MKTVCLWSGGKDSCFACSTAMHNGHEVVSLLNLIHDGGHSSLSHKLSPEAVSRQAETMGIPLLRKAMSRISYRDDFTGLLKDLKNTHDIRGAVFGDIFLKEHKDWIDSACSVAEVEAIFPLWGRDTGRLALEITDSGIQAVVVAVNTDLLGKEWLGRSFDRVFLKSLPQNIDPCGEKGEFHTWVYNSPFFKQTLKFRTGKTTANNNHSFLEIKL